MKTELQQIISMKNFFSVKGSSYKILKYTLKTPSILLVQNIHVQWLQSLWLKANKNFPIFINKEDKGIKSKLPFGTIQTQGPDYDEEKVVEHNINKYIPDHKRSLKFRMLVPENEIMQNFIHWQRYRKFWWSSVSLQTFFQISLM